MRTVLHAITILIIQLGIYYFTRKANETEDWANAYYVWDKVVMVLLVLCCIFPKKTLIPFWFVIGIFFVVRLLLEASYLTAIAAQVNNFLTQYRIMFLINFICTGIVLRKAMKWQ